MSAKKSKKPFNLKEYIADPKNKTWIIRALTAVLVISVLSAGFLVVKRKFLDENISWTLTEEGVLTISGTGAIEAADPLKPDEWLNLKSDQKITQIIIKEGITEIGDYAFYKCNKATKISLPKSLKSVGNFAFMGCTKIDGFKLGDKVTSIGKGAFYGCSAAKQITLPKGITYIGYDAFYGTGYYKESDNWEKNALYIGNYLIDVKESAEGEFEAKKGTTFVADYAFSECGKLEKISLPATTTSVGAYAFNGCTALKQVVINGKLEKFSEGMFWNCVSLEKISGEHIFKDPTYYEKNAGKGWSHNSGTAHEPVGDRYFSYTKN